MIILANINAIFLAMYHSIYICEENINLALWILKLSAIKDKIAKNTLLVIFSFEIGYTCDHMIFLPEESIGRQNMVLRPYLCEGLHLETKHTFYLAEYI